MARVLDSYGKPHEVKDELLMDFFGDVILLESETLLSFLNKLKPRSQKQLMEYITWRIAEVDSGYLDKEASSHWQEL